MLFKTMWQKVIASDQFNKEKQRIYARGYAAGLRRAKHERELIKRYPGGMRVLPKGWSPIS